MTRQPEPWWRQISVTFIERDAAEQHVFTRLAPALLHLDAGGLVTSFSFLRKKAWRFRYMPVDEVRAEQARVLLHESVNALRDDGLIERCVATIYEPETVAFGGEQGMTAAHDLFHADSRNILTSLAHLHEGPVRRRELSLLLCAALLQAAGLDWFEQGDVWAKVAKLRPIRQRAPASRRKAVQEAVERLLVSDTRPGSELRTGPLAFASDWVACFETAGRTLRGLADEGLLGGEGRGIRAVLAHHVIFHWNRIGLPAHTQAHLASAAQDVVFAD